MLFRIGKSLFTLAIRQFFASIKVSGAAPLETGALIVLPNHANHFLDPLLVCGSYTRPFWFIAKGSLFSNAIVSGILRAAHLVPIFRKEDDPQKMANNQESFEIASRVLREAKGLVLFPEGKSIGQRKLEPLKTGAARIAFQAEQSSDWQLGLAIQPVGITYSDFDEFRSSVTIHLGKPFHIQSYKDRVNADSVQAVRDLTEEIEGHLKALTVQISESSHIELIEKISKLYQLNGSQLDDKERISIVTQNVEKLAPLYPEKAREIEDRLDELLAMLATIGVGASSPGWHMQGKLPLPVTLPVVFVGLVTHLVPYKLVSPIVRKLSKDPVALGGLKVTTGLLLFLSWYLLLYILLLSNFSFIWSMLWLAFIVYSGHFVNRNFDAIKLSVISRLWPGENSPLQVLNIMREELIQELETLRIS